MSLKKHGVLAKNALTVEDAMLQLWSIGFRVAALGYLHEWTNSVVGGTSLDSKYGVSHEFGLCAQVIILEFFSLMASIGL